MSSDARKRANKLNAQKSSGPKTEAGKKRSRCNRLKHGLSAEHVVLPHENFFRYAAAAGRAYRVLSANWTSRASAACNRKQNKRKPGLASFRNLPLPLLQ